MEQFRVQLICGSAFHGYIEANLDSNMRASHPNKYEYPHVSKCIMKSNIVLVSSRSFGVLEIREVKLELRTAFCVAYDVGISNGNLHAIRHANT